MLTIRHLAACGLGCAITGISSRRIFYGLGCPSHQCHLSTSTLLISELSKYLLFFKLQPPQQSLCHMLFQVFVTQLKLSDAPK